MKGTTKYHDYKIKTMRKSTVLFSVYTCPPPGLAKNMEVVVATEAGNQLISLCPKVPKTEKMNLDIHIRT